jgi:hypothetical protein
MTIEILRVLAFDGPNMLGPLPGVLLEASSTRDHGARLRAALKDSAQAIGIVIGALDSVSRPVDDGYRLTASFTTPTPALGAAAARYVIGGLAAREQRDSAWDAEEALWALQRRRRAEALPLPVLQVLAEAAARAIPAFVRVDGGVQVGYGVRGTVVQREPPATQDSSRVTESEIDIGAPLFAPVREAEQIVWERLGTVPIVALVGADAGAVVDATTARLTRRGLRTVSAVGMGFDEARALLTDPMAEALVLGLDTTDVVRRGLPFAACAASAVRGMPAELPAEVLEREELARALGVVMLVTDAGGVAVLDGDTPEVAALAQYAPCRVEWWGGEEDLERVAETLAAAIV